VRRDWIDRLHPVGVGWNSVINSRDFSRPNFRLKPHAGRWESGSLNVAGITALGASLELLLNIGTPAIAERVVELTDHLCDGAEKRGIEVFSSRRADEKSGIVSLLLPGQDLREIVQRCREQGIVVNHRLGRLRVSPHCYNSFEELDRLLDLLSPS
jgi:selenocysteine lyase/cysteine desulfurase